MAAEINNIPYKIYLSEDEIPKAWYNVRADMKVKPAPLLNPGTGKPMGFEDLRPVFCDELIRQELDNDDREIPIPQEILDFYKMYRPSPLVRAYCLEKALGAKFGKAFGMTCAGPAAIGVVLADTAVKAANVEVVGYSSPGNGGTSFSNEVILCFSGDSGAVRQAVKAAIEVGKKLLGALGDEPKSTTTPYI